MATAFNSTSPELFMEALRGYLQFHLDTARQRVRIDTEPDSEFKGADGQVVALFLSNPSAYQATEQGAGRWTFQVARALKVRIFTTDTGDHGSDRTRLLFKHWAFETKVLNVLLAGKFREFGWNKPPALVSDKSQTQHTRVLAGGLQSELAFEIVYTAAIEQENLPV